MFADVNVHALLSYFTVIELLLTGGRHNTLLDWENSLYQT